MKIHHSRIHALNFQTPDEEVFEPKNHTSNLSKHLVSWYLDV